MVVYPGGAVPCLGRSGIHSAVQFKLLRNPFGVAVGFVKLDGISVVARDTPY
jgi:hypothetical protein